MNQSNAELIKRIGDRDVILSFSGGKDSTACGLWLQEQGIPFRALFLDTGWEHRDTYAHIEKLEARFGPVIRVQSAIEPHPAYINEIAEIEAMLGRSSPMVRWCVKKAMFPSRLARWCSSELKVIPFVKWCKANDAEIVNVIGIRRGESEARKRWAEWEDHRDADGVEVFAPLVEWSEADVIDIHRRHGVTPCPLYLRGATRVGCWPCINSSRVDLRLLSQDPERVAIIEKLEALVTKIATKEGHKYADSENGPGVWAFFQAKIADPRGAVSYPTWPIAKVLDWANRTPRSRMWQMDLFAAAPTEAGCARWGMCDHPAAKRPS